MLPSIFGESLLDDIWGSGFDRDWMAADRELYGKRAKNLMKTDVRETAEGYEMDIELPGFKKEDIKLDVENDCLTISAERKAETKDEKENYVKRERVYGSFTRCFDVSGINVDGIEASYTDGMLNVTLPKKAAEVPASRRLEIK